MWANLATVISIVARIRQRGRLVQNALRAYWCADHLETSKWPFGVQQVRKGSWRDRAARLRSALEIRINGGDEQQGAGRCLVEAETTRDDDH